MPLIGAAKALLANLLLKLVLGLRSLVLERPRLRAALRAVGRPAIWLTLRLNPPPAPPPPPPPMTPSTIVSDWPARPPPPVFLL
jgi:hypothetical protein